MTNPLRFWPAALAMALVLGAPRSADACYDEHVSQVGPVRITVDAGESGGRLSCGVGATTCATWAARLARLLPGGARLEIRSGYDVTQSGDNDVEIELCLPRRRCRVTVSDTDEIGEIFDKIAARLGTGRARRARIRRSGVAYFTLQAGAFARVEAAQALARRIDDETGGLGVDVMLAHPGPTHAAWVEEVTLRGGGRVHRVMAGTFAGRASAVHARARVVALTGEMPIVLHPLGLAVLYRRFGRTEIDMSVFTCGGMRAQQSWQRSARISAASQANVDGVVARALAVGINHFETARGYGTSEAQLGKALAKHPRDAFVLQTKLRPNEDQAAFETQLEESFSSLGVDRIDLLSFHGLNSPNCVDLTLRTGGGWEVADRFRRAGRIRHIGFSTHAPTRLLLDIIRSDRFDYVNLHAYYLFQDNLPAVAAARERDMGVFVISPTDKGGRLYAPSDKLRALTAPLSPMAFNDLWCLSQMDVHTLSLGAAVPSDFDAHVEALALFDDAPRLLPPIVARLESAYADALGADFARRWSHGLPEWTELPGKINVRRILWLYNLVRAYGLIHFAQERYISMSADNHWVPGARAVDFNDTEMTAALPESPFRAEIPGLLRRAHEMLYNPTVKPRP